MLDGFTSTNIAIEFVAFFLSLATLIGALVLTHKKKYDKAQLVFLMLMLFFSTLSNCLYFVFKGQEGEKIKILLFILKFIKIDAGFWLVAEINSLIISAIGKSKKEYKIYRISVFVLMGVMTVLLIVNGFSNFIYSIDENNIYQRENAFFIIHVAEGLVWAADAVLLFLNRKSLSKQIKTTFCICLALLIVTTVLQFVFRQIAFYDAIISMSLVVMLFGEQAQMMAELVERDKQLSRQRSKLLQRQVSPHFIYNALTAIQVLPNNPYETKKAIGDFAKYLRHTLSATNENELIPFEKELENVQAYFHLEKIRFGNNLNIVYDVTEKDFQIPIMCVQILAENAVKHGISVRSEGGTIRISSKRQDDSIFITVSDDGVGFDTVKAFDETHVGLKNVRSRIHSLVNGELIVNSEIGVGTTATIRIPISAK
ncbi:MAG: histidine kinase [Clostridia bacterium]|nr:histidine kinase [Clostridia bacterium]